MTISVDPNVIPLGSKVLISFQDPAYKKYNGVYTARDTGGAIKNRKIDIFFGDFGANKASQKTLNFGRTKAKVVVLRG